jgi:hypothetical protein
LEREGPEVLATMATFISGEQLDGTREGGVNDNDNDGYPLEAGDGFQD